jgi:hypothetical protein
VALDLGTTGTRASLAPLAIFDPNSKPDIVLGTKPNDNTYRGLAQVGDFPSAGEFFELDKPPALCIDYLGNSHDQTPVKMYPHIARIVAMHNPGVMEGEDLEEDYQTHETNFPIKHPLLERFFDKFNLLDEDKKARVMAHARKVALAHLGRVRSESEKRARTQSWKVTKLAATVPLNWDRWTRRIYMSLFQETWNFPDGPVSKRRRARKTRLRQGSSITIADGQALQDQKHVEEQIQQEDRKTRGRKLRVETKSRRCGVCGKTGHNVRTCQIVIKTSNEEDSSED